MRGAQVEGEREGDRADRERDRQDLAGEVEEAADDEDEDGAGEQGRVGAVAGEVLADRDLHAAEAGEGDADADRGRVAAEDADRQRDDAGEDRQLGQRERCPRAPAGARPSPRCRLFAQRPQAARLTGIRRRP